MGLRQFNEDVALARNAPIERVSNVQRGDSDAEVVFTYSHDQLSSPLATQVLFLDGESYPKCSTVMIFTASDCPRADVSPFLEQLSASMGRKNVQAIVTTISDKLTVKLETSSATDEDSDLSEPEDFEYTTGEEEEEEEEEDDDDDDYLDFESNAHMLGPVPSEGLTPTDTKRLKKQLRTAQSAGISVGVLPEGRIQEAEIISLSLRVAKLGIPGDALEVWDIKPDEYLVLLLRFPLGYPSLSDFLALPCDEGTGRFRFGKCAKLKPSLATAHMSFTNPLHQEKDGETGHESTKLEDRGDSFVPLYMSNSINVLLNKEFCKLLKTRREHRTSWDAAQEFLFRLDRGDHGANAVSDLQPPSQVLHADDHVAVSVNCPASLQHDYALDEESDLSIPLVSMQFALRRLARCTQYCMVCHQRMQEEFEALKPYVCSNYLCLYQYISLGFGPSIEYEVLNNPYVVDLLVTFFCSAAASQALREHPKGLNLRGIRTGSYGDPTTHIVAEACFTEKRIRFKPRDRVMSGTMKEGDSILVVRAGVDPLNTAGTAPSATLISNGGLERHVCRITAIGAESYSFEIVATMSGPLNTKGLCGGESAQASTPTTKPTRVLIFQYKHDTDDLSDFERSIALILMTPGIPSVLKMRDYLLRNPGRHLSSYNRIDKNSLTLLHWIVASNRSLIRQDSSVPTYNTQGQTVSPRPPAPSAINPNKVKGLPEGWMQFRFLQGTPERERLFMKELQPTSKARLGRAQAAQAAQLPTLFAWHGSPLRNWHSIIRTGLDFQTILNGRASGNGVYFSSDFHTSSGYSGIQNVIAGQRAWVNSQLNPQTAISICEVINRPDQFVSTNPHYVVDKLEWIQCRYLFVNVVPTSDALNQSLPTRPTRNCDGCIKQSPAHQLRGYHGKSVEIPLSALSSQRRRTMATSEQSGSVTAHEPSPVESLDSEEGGTDHALLMDSDDEVDDGLLETRKRRRRSSQDSVSQASSKLGKTARSLRILRGNPAVRHETDFRPGTLDLGSLPKLPEPTWASLSPAALQSLNRAIKDLQKTQSREDIGSLGWYVNFDNLNNMFHWIVELHSFDAELPLARDMKKMGVTSVVLELRFGGSYPFSPPFVRVIRPRFLPFARGGGGHVTAGGAICSEMLTNSGWSPAMTIEKVLLQVRLGLCDMNPPAKLEKSSGKYGGNDYGIREAIDAYMRAARAHGWQIPEDIKTIAGGS